MEIAPGYVRAGPLESVFVGQFASVDIVNVVFKDLMRYSRPVS